MANEKRLIDANVLMDQKPFTTYCGHASHWGKAYNECAEKAREAVRQAPTVDAVEVVRCRRCKYWQHMEEGMGNCTNGRFHLNGSPDPTMEADDFCSCGERRWGE